MLYGYSYSEQAPQFVDAQVRGNATLGQYPSLAAAPLSLDAAHDDSRIYTMATGDIAYNTNAAPFYNQFPLAPASPPHSSSSLHHSVLPHNSPHSGHHQHQFFRPADSMQQSTTDASGPRADIQAYLRAQPKVNVCFPSTSRAIPHFDADGHPRCDAGGGKQCDATAIFNTKAMYHHGIERDKRTFKSPWVKIGAIVPIEYPPDAPSPELPQPRTPDDPICRLHEDRARLEYLSKGSSFASRTVEDPSTGKRVNQIWLHGTLRIRLVGVIGVKEAGRYWVDAVVDGRPMLSSMDARSDMRWTEVLVGAFGGWVSEVKLILRRAKLASFGRHGHRGAQHVKRWTHLNATIGEIRIPAKVLSTTMMRQFLCPLWQTLTSIELRDPTPPQPYALYKKDSDIEVGAALVVDIDFFPAAMTAAIGPLPPWPRDACVWPQRGGNFMTFYQDAHVGAEHASRLGLWRIPLAGGLAYRPRNCWEDIYHSMSNAKKFIYITGWSVDISQQLCRKPHSSCAETTGALLKRKADEGVRVLVLLWNELLSSRYVRQMADGMMATHDEETREFFESTKVHCEIVYRMGVTKRRPGQPRRDRDTRNRVQRIADRMSYLAKLFFTHHQKTVICDSDPGWTPNSTLISPPGHPSSSSPMHFPPELSLGAHESRRSVIAFLGGLDLTDGRYDNVTHPLYSSLKDEHKDDFHNVSLVGATKTNSPRHPWHDIHCRVIGPAARDIMLNFESRWTRQVDCKNLKSYDSVVDIIVKSNSHKMESASWKQRIERKVVDRHHHSEQELQTACTIVLPGSLLIQEKQLTAEFLTMDQECVCAARASFMESGGRRYSLFTCQLLRSCDWNSAVLVAPPVPSAHASPALGPGPHPTPYVHPTAQSTSLGALLVDSSGRKRQVDSSIHNAYVHMIRRAKRFIYIENQYFLGSSMSWQTGKGAGFKSEVDDIGAPHLVPLELCLRVVAAIRMQQPFHIYVVLPLWPEGVPETGSVQNILHWQLNTVKMMYGTIAAELERIGSSEHPRDYLSFFSLVNRDFDKPIKKPPANGSALEKVAVSRRFPIYLHSKLIIVDDDVILLGSANINERSMSGSRDTEIAICGVENDHCRRGQVFGFRSALWAEHTGGYRDVFADPETRLCRTAFCEIANSNFRIYSADVPTAPLSGHIMTYPYDVSITGEVVPSYEFFPDTQACVAGKDVQFIPNILTT